MNWSLFKIRQYLFYLLIFILPWQTRWIVRDPYLGGEVWEYGRISLYAWDILLAVLLIFSWPMVWDYVRSIIRRIFSLRVEDSELRSPSSTPNNPALGTLFNIYFFLLLFSFTSILWSGDKLLALTWSLRLLEAGFLWLLVLTLKPSWIKVLWSLVAAGTIQSIWAIWQFLTQSSFANKWLGVAVHPLSRGGTSVVMNEYGRWLRAYAGQVHPNVLGGLLVITCLATVWLFLHHSTRVLGQKNNFSILDSRFNILSTQNVTYLLLALYIIQLTGLFYTFSRGAWLALFFTLIFLWWQRRENRKKITHVIITSAITIIVLGGIYWQPVSGRFTGASTLEQQSIEDRRGSIKESGGILSHKWIIGTGIGNYTAELAQNTPNLKAWRYQPVHNIFLLVLTELGVIGFILFIIILWKALGSFRIRNSVFIIPILFTAQFDHYWWTAPSMFLLFWLILFFKDIEKQPT